MKIAIAGCGITGTTAGYLLAQSGHEVTIFEQAEQCQAVGAGIMLQLSGQQVLMRLGIHHAMAQDSATLWGMEAKLASGKQLIRLQYNSLGPNCEAWGVHRGTLFTQLLKLCQTAHVTIQTAAQIIGYTRTDRSKMTVHSATGQSFSGYDFLIAADGSRSLLRQSTKIACKTVEYPYGALWTTGKCDLIQDHLHQTIDGTKRLVGLLPIGSGQCSFFWGIKSDQVNSLRKSNINQWKEEVRSLCPESEELLKSIHTIDQLIFTTYRHVQMDRWYDDGIVFLGDAAHPSSPHLGQGANLGLEDAATFVDTFNKANDFKTACVIFEQERKYKIQYYQQLTRLLSPFFQSDRSILGTGRNLILPWFPSIPWLRKRMLKTLCGQSAGWWK